MSGMASIQALVDDAKGGDGRCVAEDGSRGITWQRLAERVSAIPGAPESLDDERLRQLLRRNGTMPDDGTELRFALAALDIPLLTALREAGYFPDLRFGRGMAPIQVLVEIARASGIPIQVVNNRGDVVAVRFIR